MLKSTVLQIVVAGEYQGNPFDYDVYVRTTDDAFLTLDDPFDSFSLQLVINKQYDFLIRLGGISTLDKLPFAEANYHATIIDSNWKVKQSDFITLTSSFDLNTEYYVIETQYGRMIIDPSYVNSRERENLQLGKVVYINCRRLDILGFTEL